MTPRFLIIKTGKTHDGIRAQFGCFEDWMAAGLGVDSSAVDVVSVFTGDALPPAFTDAQGAPYAGVVITGSPAMVTDKLDWSEATAAWLAREIGERGSRVPVLGICYGHQLLAHALGGAVAYNPQGREIGTVDICLTQAHADDPLFHALAPVFAAHVTHLQSVTALPPGSVHLAHSTLEPHHAFRYGERVWGVQFHPEFCDGIMRAYIDALAERMAAEGLDPAAVLAGVRKTPLSRALLRRFGELAIAACAEPANALRSAT